MKISVNCIVYKQGFSHKNAQVELLSSFLNSYDQIIKLDDCYAYPPLINSHDHLIGNWFPRAGDTDLYPNAHVWVKDMKESEAVKERDKIWVNSLPMNFFNGNGKLLAQLGGYKNLLSGVTAVQDHAPIQQEGYYDMFPINVLRKYRQCHSLSLGNFWGGEEPQKEMELSKGEMPFIVHLGEGLDSVTANEFSQLKELDLLHNNTMIIHGIALTEKDIKECADRGATLCWCAFSNIFLIGKTLDIESCLKYGVKVVIGTDSTLSGSVNLLEEMRYAKSVYPRVSNSHIFKMVTENAAQALFLPEKYGCLPREEATDSLLLLRAKSNDPYDNILECSSDDIVLLLNEGKPIFGQRKLLEHFKINEDDYFFYRKEDTDYFVIGHPEILMQKIQDILGYEKKLPYLPF